MLRPALPCVDGPTRMMQAPGGSRMKTQKQGGGGGALRKTCGWCFELTYILETHSFQQVRPGSLKSWVQTMSQESVCRGEQDGLRDPPPLTQGSRVQPAPPAGEGSGLCLRSPLSATQTRHPLRIPTPSCRRLLPARAPRLVLESPEL